MHIIPAILPKTRKELMDKLQQLVGAGYRGRIQIDFCDGMFVESTTWPLQKKQWWQFWKKNPDIFDRAKGINQDRELQNLLRQFTIDIDLMVSNPMMYFGLCESVYADRVIVHVDSIASDDLKESLSIWLGGRTGPFECVNRETIVMACSLNTPLESFEYWYRFFDLRKVQIMGIETIGKQGESFSEKTIQYIDAFQKKYPDTVIMVDGGVSISTLPRLVEQGVTSAVAGSAVFTGDIAQNIHNLGSYGTL